MPPQLPAQSPVGRVVGQLRNRLLSSVPRSAASQQQQPHADVPMDVASSDGAASGVAPSTVAAPLHRRSMVAELSPDDVAARRQHRHSLAHTIDTAELPNLDTDASRAVLRSIAQAAAIDAHLKEAARLVEHMAHMAAIGSSTMLPKFSAGAGGTAPPALTLEDVERRSGVVGRLHSQRQRRVQARRLFPSDVQFSEVLPSGRVVTLTQSTLPSQVASLASDSAAAMFDQLAHRSSVGRAAQAPADAVVVSPLSHLPSDNAAERDDADGITKATREAEEQQEVAMHHAAARGVAVYLHVVLHKCGMPLHEAVAAIATAAPGGGGITPTDVAVNVVLDDQSATTQTCSIRIGTLGALLDKDPATVNTLEHVFACNLRATPLRLQWLSLRFFPCALSAGSACRVRCTAMLRGIHVRPSAVRAAAKRALRLAPNFFGPRRFYASASLHQNRFWHYHVAEAVGLGMYRAALAMLTANAAAAATTKQAHHGRAPVNNTDAHLTDDVALCGGAAWVGPFLALMREGEDREVAYRELFHRNVPHGLRHLIGTSRECLAFNALLSVRVRALGASSSASQWTAADDGAELDEPGIDAHQDQVSIGGGLNIGDLVAIVGSTNGNVGSVPGNDDQARDDDRLPSSPGAGDDIGPTLETFTKMFRAAAAQQQQQQRQGDLNAASEEVVGEYGTERGDDGAMLNGSGDAADAKQQRADALPSGFPSIPSGVAFDTKWELLAPPSTSAPIDGTEAVSVAEDEAAEEEAVLGHVDVVRTHDDGMLRSMEGLLLPLRASSPGMARLWRALGLHPAGTMQVGDAAAAQHNDGPTDNRKKRRSKKQRKGTSEGATTTPTPHPSVPSDPSRRRVALRHAFVGASIGVVPAAQYRNHLRPAHHRRQRRRVPQAHLYVRSISEVAEMPYASPSAVDADDTAMDHGDGDTTTVLRLATDAELTGVAKKQFASQSRGDRPPLWPIGRVGHRLSDRLPVGALADASDHLGGGGGKSLVMLFEVPANAYVSSVFREFVTIKQQRQQEQPKRAAASRQSTTAAAVVLNRQEDTGAPSAATAADRERVADGNILGLSVRGGMSIHEAVRKGYKTDVLATGRSVPRHLVDDNSKPLE